MRLRVFEARTLQEALARMRETLGPDAVIVSTRERPDGVTVAAAVETAEPDLEALLARPPTSPALQAARAVLEHHGLPPSRAEALLAASTLPSSDPAAVLADALARRYRFPEPGTLLPRAVVLVGAPGAGKTAALARLAAGAVLAGETVTVLSADTDRAGGFEQLRALLAPLRIEPRPTGEAGLAPDPGQRTLVDGPGVNPFRRDEMAELAELVRRLRCEPVLVLPAGLDVEDCAELAANFQAMGVRRTITTRLDLARRLGGILAAAELGLELSFAATSPLIGKPLLPWSPAGLARLLLARAPTAAGERP
ncbi:MAG: hypothetical protein RMJ04_10900 [Geminicoccaceae bacterium]|nr:hypothetical protein [Geminicoccaceae bacterium]MDW8125269.1 hypothetical protein [Geminicoccaceae bacterium]